MFKRDNTMQSLKKELLMKVDQLSSQLDKSHPSIQALEAEVKHTRVMLGLHSGEISALTTAELASSQGKSNPTKRVILREEL